MAVNGSDGIKGRLVAHLRPADFRAGLELRGVHKAPCALPKLEHKFLGAAVRRFQGMPRSINEVVLPEQQHNVTRYIHVDRGKVPGSAAR